MKVLKPTVGRWVHYRARDGVLPALVVWVNPADPRYCELVIFSDRMAQRRWSEEFGHGHLTATVQRGEFRYGDGLGEWTWPSLSHETMEVP